MRSYLFTAQHHVHVSSQGAQGYGKGYRVLVCHHGCCGRGRYLSVSKTHDDKRFRGSYAFKEVPAAPGPCAPLGSFRTVMACWFTLWLYMCC